MDREIILARLQAIITEWEATPDPYRYREMSSRGADSETIARYDGRDEGREEVVGSIRDLIADIKHS